MPDQPKRHPIPLITQYATPGLINAIAYEGHPPGDDDNWQTSGAPDKAAYGHWCTRICGMACLRMALFARDGQAPTLFDLLNGCLAYGGYVEREDGGVGGLYYRPFTEYALAAHGLQSEIITDLTPDRLVTELDQGRLVIASVHKEIRRPDLPTPGRGGHLVLVTGHRDGQVSFRNPSGHTAGTVDATLPLDLLDCFAAQRGIALHL
ncbi:C39 family peptidase [Streptomyces sp. BE20]|uniref:C39 family peptidase n=1 Tax=Streptomyces sp. BE20 TaxID=3002525 RepID=UPI002E78E2D9|nr:C39 family peptidase [Streptomyces sp. BE20]MEE1829265.1 C39 family peptidase [Streptomyces sp. BE20]